MDTETYAEGLEATKSHYPFAEWQETGAEMYTDEVCARIAGIFDRLIQKLIAAGLGAEEPVKLGIFEEAVRALNQISDEDEGLIETSERDELCVLCDVIAVAGGMEPARYGGGEGVATEWREW